MWSEEDLKIGRECDKRLYRHMTKNRWVMFFAWKNSINLQPFESFNKRWKRDCRIAFTCRFHLNLRAAIRGGWDSVYFGIEQLQYEGPAANLFTPDEIPNHWNHPEHNKNATWHWIQSSMTMTWVWCDIVDRAQESGVNAIIVPDHAVELLQKKICRYIFLPSKHSNVEAVEFMGVCGCNGIGKGVESDAG